MHIKTKRSSRLRGWSTVAGSDSVRLSVVSFTRVSLTTDYQVVFGDYFSAILGLVRDGNSWTLTPFDVSIPVIAEISLLSHIRKFVRKTTHFSSVARVTLLVAKYVCHSSTLLIMLMAGFSLIVYIAGIRRLARRMKHGQNKSSASPSVMQIQITSPRMILWLRPGNS